MNLIRRPSLQSFDTKRLVYVLLSLFFLFSLLIIQFYRIQIIQGNFWSEKARRQHFFAVKEPARRGTIYSNTSVKPGLPENPQKLVIDVQRFHLYIDPGSIPEKNRNEIAAELGKTLHLKNADQLSLRQQFNKKSRSRKLAMWLDMDTRKRIMEWWMPYARKRKIVRNALYFVPDYQRSYPFGKLLGQVLQTVNHYKDEATQQAAPTGGLELYFDSFLKGKEGKRLLMRSPRNEFERGEILSPPEDGADIHLTINHCLQAIAEEELAKGVEKSKAKSGWAVMMDPFTGEILALAQYPFFYPSDYESYFGDPLLIDHTRVKPVTDAFEPGSVMKAFTMSIALSANEELQRKQHAPLFDPEEKIATSDGKFPGRSKPLKDTRPQPFMNMNMAIQKSSNIYPARIVEKIIARLGADWYRNKLESVFGFNKKTGIELPSETKGILPRIGKKHPNGALEWSASTPSSLSIGYNLQVNSVQLARACSVLANGGYLVQPTLVRKIAKKKAGEEESVVVDNTAPARTASFPRVLSSRTVSKVVNALKYTTKAGGAAPWADIRGYTECGKTGTSKKNVAGKYLEKSYRCSFMGFTPVDNPAFVLVLTVDEPQVGLRPGPTGGATVAAPIFREISKRSLEYLGVSPDDPHGYPTGDPRSNPEKADWMNETRRLQEMYQKWNNKTQTR